MPGTAVPPCGATGDADRTAPVRYDALILAGGSARRLGRLDKATLVVGKATLLDRALAAVTTAGRTVVVGPRRECAVPVMWTREDPPGGGPAAAVAAGLALVTAPLVVVLAVDMPFAAGAVPRLLSELAGADADGVVLGDATGRVQPLLAAYRVASLRRAAGRSALTGSPMWRLVADLTLVTVPAVGPEAVDCDTHQGLWWARREADRGP